MSWSDKKGTYSLSTFPSLWVHNFFLEGLWKQCLYNGRGYTSPFMLSDLVTIIKFHNSHWKFTQLKMFCLCIAWVNRHMKQKLYCLFQSTLTKLCFLQYYDNLWCLDKIKRCHQHATMLHDDSHESASVTSSLYKIKGSHPQVGNHRLCVQTGSAGLNNSFSCWTNRHCVCH